MQNPSGVQNLPPKANRWQRRHPIPPEAVLQPASSLPAMAQPCWLRTQDSTVGSSKLVSDYFVSRAAIIRTPQHNLFTARRLSVGSSRLSPWNNCCDDRLWWEHIQACENMHHFRLEALERQPSWRDCRSDIIPVCSSDQILALCCPIPNVRGLLFISSHRLNLCLFCTESGVKMLHCRI